MFSYYGRKSKIVNKYPEPKFGTIIEPFAGSATYAYKFWEKDVILVDGFQKVIKIWQYLQKAKPEDILKLPDVQSGEFIGDKHLWMCEEERWLMGYCINNGSALPKKTAGMFNSWNRDKIRIAQDLHKIKHWKFVLGDYHCLKNIEATWYIDPPYQHNVYKYGYNKPIDYKELGEWSGSRKGQVIACDNAGADWLDFKPLVTMHNQRKANPEVIWTNSLIQI